MSKHIHGRSKILQNYIITYFVVFAVPLVMFSYIIYRQSIVKFSEQYIKTAQTAAEGVSTNLVRLMASAASTANIVRENPYFSSSSIRNFAGSFVYIDKTMCNIGSLNKDFLQIAFYSTQSDLIYTNSTFNRSFYFENIFCSEQLNGKTSFNELAVPEWISMQPVKFDKQPTFVSSLIYPVERSIKKSMHTTNSIMMVHLDITRIRQLLSPITAIPDTHAVVFYDGKPIFADDYKTLQYFLKDNSNLTNNSMVSMENTQYLIRWTDRGNKISILSLLPQNNVQKLASDIMIIYLLSLSLSVVTGIILIFFSVRHNYQPILRLFKKVSRAVDIFPDEIKYLDEVSQTSYALDNLIENKKQMEIDQYQMKLSHVLLRLLENSSAYSRQSSFERRASELQLNFEANAYCCILFSHCFDRELLLCTLLKLENDFQGKLFYTSDMDETSAVVLLCCDSNNDDTVNWLLEKTDTMFECVGIGNFVYELSNVTVSYKQAYHALINTSDNTRIHKYSNLQTIGQNDVLTQFAKESELFSCAITDYEQSRMLLSLSRISNLLELVVSSQGPVDMLLHHILFVAVKALAAANIPFNSTIELFGNLLKPEKDIVIKDWLHSFSTHLSNLMSEHDKYEQDKPHKEAAKDIQYVLLYINLNYMKNDFSIKMLADEMKMSVSNLSHFFKSRLSKNISDYINDLRITEAKRLLRETDMKIAEIVPLLGYAHPSSFTKSFKQSTGKTPSEYKNEYKSE